MVMNSSKYPRGRKPTTMQPWGLRSGPHLPGCRPDRQGLDMNNVTPKDADHTRMAAPRAAAKEKPLPAEGKGGVDWRRAFGVWPAPPLCGCLVSRSAAATAGRVGLLELFGPQRLLLCR